uniref:SDR family NAD(P)-dependent oxidoreductase n=1 Tax=Bacillus paralicheniformis TaxID=1648923 RepID=UPI00131A2031|nr:SDR family NAD(P)-dependent oxidoreductase [Bacillus paralicheniformis]
MRNDQVQIEKTERIILGKIGDILGQDKIDEQSNFLELDINSVQSVELVEELNQELGLQLGVEVIFDYSNARELSTYIVQEHMKSDMNLNLDEPFGSLEEIQILLSEVLADVLDMDIVALDMAKSFLELEISSIQIVEFVESLNQKMNLNLGIEIIFDYQNVNELSEYINNTYQRRQENLDVGETNSHQVNTGDIAIIGISGRFAGSDRVDDFWEHLKAGNSCIEDIERRNWNEEEYYDSNPNRKNTSISKKGGLIRDVERFDNRFFNISPLEAERMDPQQRLFLEEAYKSIEDAGYAATEFEGRRIGVFVGGRSSDYKDRTLEREEINSQTFLGNDMAILAARISYYLNLKGPNMAIDTACSSSLVALHLACDSIRKGESEAALAGGVFILGSPEFYVMTSKTNMLSPDGKCKTFDNSANGIVVGEGVGVAVLKRLDAALQDGDHIYGVIKGSSVNQDGRTKGITAPSMLSQKRLIEEAYTNANVDPETVSYIEAHGTGTKLGDPIEIKALNESFQEFTDKKNFCAIGSHKPNFGHSIMSAGIAGVFKVLLAMKHKLLPPTIQVEEINQHINFKDSPFYLNQKLTEWKALSPLRAGVSSFGFSGTNCHIVLEEAPYTPQNANQSQPYYWFPISAKTIESLEQKIVDLYNYLSNSDKEVAIESVSYTLVCGRAHFSERCSYIACDLDDLIAQLQGGIPKGRTQMPHSERGKKAGEQLIGELINDMGDQPEVYKQKLQLLSSYYEQGIELSLEKLFKDRQYQRISLPTYPFKGDKYWFADREENHEIQETAVSVKHAVHPLLHQNISTLWEQGYRTMLTGQEFFLRDHVVKGQKILPGVAYLEMAREAVQQAAEIPQEESAHFMLRHVVWMSPIFVEDQPMPVDIRLRMDDEDHIKFEVSAPDQSRDEMAVCAQGTAGLRRGEEPLQEDLIALQSECSDHIAAQVCYAAFRSIGFEYGPSHQGIEKVCFGSDRMLVKIVLPESVTDTKNHFIMHPSVLDAAFQATIVFTQFDRNGKDSSLSLKPILPFAVDELQVMGSCSTNMWAIISYSDSTRAENKNAKVDIRLCDEHGNVRVYIKGFSTRVVEERIGASSSMLLLHPDWVEKESISENVTYGQQIVIVCERDRRYSDYIESHLKNARCLSLQLTDAMTVEQFQNNAATVFEEIRSMCIARPEGRVLVQAIIEHTEDQWQFRALGGLFRTLQKEYPKFVCQCIELDAGDDPESMIIKLDSNSGVRDSLHIKYDRHKRYELKWKEMELKKLDERPPWRDQGVYLITGGAGGLGLLLAEEIIKSSTHITMILTGRSKLNDSKLSKIAALRSYGAQVEYIQTDVTVESQVRDLIANVTTKYGTLHGIIHAAGMIQDNYIVKKSKQQFIEVLSPKVRGIHYLDQAAREIALDFFLLFSSISGSLGHPGQADYSTANAYLDAFAAHRNHLVSLGQRQGHTLSVNWPLWRKGGMTITKPDEQYMAKQMGIFPMQTENGLKALYCALQSGKSQVMVLEGDLSIMKPKYVLGEKHTEKSSLSSAASYLQQDLSVSIAGSVQKALIKAVSKLLKVKMEDVEPDLELTEYGFDSILFTQLANSLSNEYKLDLVPTIFFEYPTIEEFAVYLIDEYQEVMQERFAQSASLGMVETAEPAVESSGEGIEDPPHSMKPQHVGQRQPRFHHAACSSQLEKKESKSKEQEAIAIIGMSGIYPKASDTDELWQNLLQGMDCISEIPQDRWDWQALFGDPKEKNKTNIKWGGFIEGIDQFDPLFFGISPSEAELMDPQQRLLMTYVWKAIEDAGYAASSLSGTNTGIYVGVSNSGYASLLTQANVPIESYSATGWVGSIGPNRMSYFLDVHGPSEPIETSCSSSLIAINRGIRAIQDGRCDMAIVGGINTILTPDAHISFNKAGMLSVDGRCKTFSDKANGYVRGEGVGMLVLKKCSEAERAGDHIYGVIRGGSENHGGHANSLTAPNPKAQAELLIDAYSKAGVDPRTVSYIEAHGTGTPLGDPIEINALKAAFKEMNKRAGYYSQTQAYCGVGSVKTNIGHLEVAAGVAGVVKVLLQLKHKTLVKSLHSEQINHYIQLKDSPFYIVQEAKEWEALTDDHGHPLPRRAGVSSFGFGGVNAHIVIEEYIPQEVSAPAEPVTSHSPAVIVLSARDEDRLRERVQQLLSWLENRQVTDEDLAGIAYTLQVGREAMEVRLGFTAGTIEELKEKLRTYDNEESDVYLGQIKRHKETLSVFAADEDMQETIEKWMHRRKYVQLLDVWVKGMNVEWDKLYGERHPRRISLPTYPFAKERYWVPKGSELVRKSTTASVLHPLLHQNTSHAAELRFSTTFTGQEFFLSGHQVMGRKVLPGVAYLEMAREAIVKATGIPEMKASAIRMNHIAWMYPLHVDEDSVVTHIRLEPEESGAFYYEIYGTQAGSETVYSQGRGTLIEGAVSKLDLDALLERCRERELSALECREAFAKLGLNVGEGHQGLRRMLIGKAQVLAELSLPPSLVQSSTDYTLHPSLVDGALQAALGLGGLQEDGELSLPFALDELEVLSPCSVRMWAWVRPSQSEQSGNSNIQKLDIDVCHEDGRVAIRMRGYASRVPSDQERLGLDEVDEAIGMMLVERIWEKSELTDGTAGPDYTEHLVFIDESDPNKLERLRKRLGVSVSCLTLTDRTEKIEERYEHSVLSVFERIQSIIRSKREGLALIQVVVNHEGTGRLLSGLTGMLQTANLEQPRIIGQLIETAVDSDETELCNQLLENKRCPADSYIRYIDHQRYVAKWKEIQDTAEEERLAWKEDGVYVITGGTGRLGLHFAYDIARRTKNSTLVLTGRSAWSEAKQEQLKDLVTLGATVVYKQVNLNDKQEVALLLRDIKETYGAVNGIIHSAGMIQDSYLLKKQPQEVQAVLTPKVTGTVYLDEASKDLDLDFFVLFSSIAGALGNPGQADYAVANAFMDRYAAYRNDRVAAGERSGRTLSVNWPLWKDGGIQLDEEAQQMIFQKTGITSMGMETGLVGFHQAVSLTRPQIMVAYGQKTAMLETWLTPNNSTVMTQNLDLHVTNNQRSAKLNISAEVGESLTLQAAQYLKKLLARIIKLPVNRIEVDAPMERYGIDSIMVMKLTNQLETVFGSLSKTLFFEYKSIQELAQYFSKSHAERLKELLQVGSGDSTKVHVNNMPIQVSTMKQENTYTRYRKLRSSVDQQPDLRRDAVKKEDRSLDIAIVGLSGRYPMAVNIQEYWQNLKKGKDCITEIPNERWDYRLYSDKQGSGKKVSKWGGFIDGVDQFDPLFFNISPKEAEFMDPQERLFLECVYEAMEDSGYTKEELGKFGRTLVGVYVGVMYEEYQLYGAQAQQEGHPIALSGSPASIANRVSYYCNFNGPSIAVDTMCSSSLTAIHLACQSLQKGECSVAIAGGVNVSVHPNKYLMLSNGNFLSSKGKCESFGAGGDGYVPGEGVGAVLLKPLAEAIADGDNIYGVIKGSAINHGGKTNGYTVPNPHAQANVISRAFSEAKINPKTISYIEAHGTGTSLGDPIEIAGLTKTFREYTEENQFCAIGSAKSNIGHCESAAGIAGVTKVLLQLRHKQLVPSVHARQLNPNIDFGQTPFVVQQELTDWKRPMLDLDGTLREYPRIAGISSFGAGGSNAHIVIEEYIPQEVSAPAESVTSHSPAVIVLSARDEDRLRERVQQLLSWLENRQVTDEDLAGIAYTLQVGREAMEVRLGFTAGTIEELKEKLRTYDNEESDVYLGQIKRHKETLSVFAADEDMQETIEKWMHRRKYVQLLDVWVKGMNVEWDKLYGERHPRRISLPTYPFAKERYWVPKGSELVRKSTTASVLHPLLHQNTSHAAELRFSTTFTGQEFFLSGHQVMGRKVLPGVAYLEMAREAIVKATGIPEMKASAIRMNHIAWMYPLHVDEDSVVTHIRLEPEESGAFYYEIYGTQAGSETVYSQGRGTLIEGAVSKLDLDALLERCRERELSALECREAFAKLGLNVGEGHQGLRRMLIGKAQVLAELSLPPGLVQSSTDYTLHPSLVDGALQAALGLGGLQEDGELSLPFALDELEVLSPCSVRMWAWVRPSQSEQSGNSNIQKLDIDVCHEDGRVAIRMRGYASRVPSDQERLGLDEVDEAIGMMLVERIWEKSELTDGTAGPDYTEHLVFIDESDPNKLERLRKRLGVSVSCLTLTDRTEKIEERYEHSVLSVFERIQSIIRSKREGLALIQVVVNHEGTGRLLSGLTGMLQTANLEQPRIIGQLIETAVDSDETELCNQLLENKRCPADSYIRYIDHQRYVAKWKEIQDTAEEERLAWKEDGVYVITGGTGRLGLHFAYDIARRTKNSTLVLTGRSAWSEAKQEQLKDLVTLGATVVYKQVNLNDKQEVALLLRDIKETYGAVNGIIHSAGMIQDSYLLKKQPQEVQAVLTPKVTGTVYLDEASKDLDLDFFVLFSSIAGALGNPGQADYAVANAFMDRYAAYRNDRVAAGERSGRTLSVNWPLWKDGGIQLDEEAQRILLRNFGIKPLQTDYALQAFHLAMTMKCSQLIVLEGHLTKLRTFVGLIEEITSEDAYAQVQETEDDALYTKLIEDIVRGKLSIEQWMDIIS